MPHSSPGGTHAQSDPVRIYRRSRAAPRRMRQRADALSGGAGRLRLQRAADRGEPLSGQLRRQRGDHAADGGGLSAVPRRRADGADRPRLVRGGRPQYRSGILRLRRIAGDGRGRRQRRGLRRRPVAPGPRRGRRLRKLYGKHGCPRARRREAAGKRRRLRRLLGRSAGSSPRSSRAAPETGPACWWLKPRASDGRRPRGRARSARSAAFRGRTDRSRAGSGCGTRSPKAARAARAARP